MIIRGSANAQREMLRRPGSHNPQWLVEDLFEDHLFPLGAVEVGWSDELIDFNYELLDLGLKVAHPVDERTQWWRDRRVTKHGAAALLYGGESIEKGVSGRLIVLDPKHPQHIVTEANHKLFEHDACGRYRLSPAGAELERILLSIEGLRLIVFSLLWPFLPNGFGVPGRSIPAWAWLRELAQKTGAAVVVTLDGPKQLNCMWRKGISLASERRPPPRGAK